MRAVGTGQPLDGDQKWRIVQASLEARGLWNADGIGLRVKAHSCRTCGAPIMAGLDHARVAMPARADPYPLSALGEATVLLGDRATYSLLWIAGHYELNYRTSWHIEGSPAGDPTREVLAQHECGFIYSQVLLGTVVAPHRAAERTTRGMTDDPAPY